MKEGIKEGRKWLRKVLMKGSGAERNEGRKEPRNAVKEGRNQGTQ